MKYRAEKSIIALHVQFGHVKFCFNFLEQSMHLFSQASLVPIRQKSSINTIEHLWTTSWLHYDPAIIKGWGSHASR